MRVRDHLLLLICCLMYFPLFVGVLCLSLIWYALLCVLSSFEIVLKRKRELIVKYNIGLKTLLQQGISEPIFYGDLVYKFKRIVGKPNLSDQFKKTVKRYIRVGYFGYHATVCMPSFKPNQGL